MISISYKYIMKKKEKRKIQNLEAFFVARIAYCVRKVTLLDSYPAYQLEQRLIIQLREIV